MDKFLEFQSYHQSLVLVRQAEEILREAAKSIRHRNGEIAAAISGHRQAMRAVDETLRESVISIRAQLIK